MKARKYELTDQHYPSAPWLRRIRALVDIPRVGVRAGDLGGWVESEGCLAQSGDAWVSGDARVSGDAWVSGDARVSGNARVSKPNHLLTVGPIGSRAAMLTIHTDSKIGVRYSTGCFTGSREQFAAAVESSHGDNNHGRAYEAAMFLADLTVTPHAAR